LKYRGSLETSSPILDGKSRGSSSRVSSISARTNPAFPPGIHPPPNACHDARQQMLDNIANFLDEGTKTQLHQSFRVGQRDRILALRPRRAREIPRPRDANNALRIEREVSLDVRHAGEPPRQVASDTRNLRSISFAIFLLSPSSELHLWRSACRGNGSTFHGTSDEFGMFVRAISRPRIRLRKSFRPPESKRPADLLSHLCPEHSSHVWPERIPTHGQDSFIAPFAMSESNLGFQEASPSKILATLPQTPRRLPRQPLWQTNKTLRNRTKQNGVTRVTTGDSGCPGALRGSRQSDTPVGRKSA
jgi:hypothetical protein